MLMGPGGQRMILMSDIPSETAVSNLTLEFDDAAAKPLGDPAFESGTWRPANNGEVEDTFPSPAPTGPYESALAAFNGTDPNGTWRLYVTEDSGMQDSEPAQEGFASWTLDLTILPPEPPRPENPPPGEPPPPAVQPTPSPGPEVVSAAFTGRPVAGSPSELAIELRDPDAPVTGVIADFGERGGIFAESTCVTAVPSSGPLATGSKVRILLPYTFARSGPHTITLHLLSGGCGETTETVATLTVDVRAGSTTARAAAKAKPARCKGSASVPRASTLTLVEDATLCLINAERKKFRLKPLVANAKLRAAAAAHSASMLKVRRFAHQVRGEPPLVTRLRAAQYTGAGGENLGAGVSAQASARRIVAAWMKSPGHRANILTRKYRAAGIVVAVGVPIATLRNAATYTVNFGTKP
jgi:uncharacterized protein YkwD